jgi:clorobiocin biosynthesis protein CloN4
MISAEKRPGSPVQLEGIADKIRAYICEAFLNEGQRASLKNNDNLLAVLDSLQALRLVVQLEGMFDIKIPDSDLTPENLGSIDHMAAYVARQRT